MRVSPSLLNAVSPMNTGAAHAVSSASTGFNAALNAAAVLPPTISVPPQPLQAVLSPVSIAANPVTGFASKNVYTPVPAAIPAEAPRIAREIYGGHRLFHITDKAGKQSIQKNGFRLSKKDEGATVRALGATEEIRQSNAKEYGLSPQEVTELMGDARTHHYVSTDGVRSHEKMIADIDDFEDNFIDFLAEKQDGEPSLLDAEKGAAYVRFFKGDVPFEMDPDVTSILAGSAELVALRTPEDIPARQILHSKRSPATDPESAMMQKELGRRGVDVSKRQAATLLRDVQSDSETDDFPMVRGANRLKRKGSSLFDNRGRPKAARKS